MGHWVGRVSRVFNRRVYHKCFAREANRVERTLSSPLLVLDSSRQLQLRLSSIEIESKVLLVQPLFAEVKELELPREVLPHYVFGCLKESCQNSWW